MLIVRVRILLLILPRSSFSTSPHHSFRNSSRTLLTRSCHTSTFSSATRPRPPRSQSRTTSSPRTSRRSQRRLPRAPRRTASAQGPSSSHKAPTPPLPSAQRRAATPRSRRSLSTPSATSRSTTPTAPAMLSPEVSSPASCKASRSKQPSTWASGSPS